MAIELHPKLLRPLIEPRDPQAHKGHYGHLFVLAGARGFTGSARLAAEGAGRAGAGLVTVGVPETVGDVVAAGLLDFMSLYLPSTRAGTLAAVALEPALTFAAGRSAVALGPGLSQHPETAAFVRAFVPRCPAPIVIDADALNNLAGVSELLLEMRQPGVITPHPGEMARLAGASTREIQADREASALHYAQARNVVVVLKGHRTVVASPDGAVFVCPTGNPGMACGGSGDVLTGVLGALLAQGLAPLDAARLGVYIHGLAGDIAAQRMTQRAMLARDIVDALPEAWRQLES